MTSRLSLVMLGLATVVLLACGGDDDITHAHAGGDSGSAGSGPVAQEATSCKGAPLSCGSEDAVHSCCDSIFVAGGDFMMGRSETGSDACDVAWNCTAETSADTPEHKATVRPYFLDRYKVTVGRFRRFVDQYDGTPPAVGAGAHPSNPASGWQEDWNQYLPVDKNALIQDQLDNILGTLRYTEQPGAYENIPATAGFALAHAFCIWDGGRMVTEPEWEFAAAGGDSNLRYPWGHDFPGDPRAALKICEYDGECNTLSQPESCSAPEKCHFAIDDVTPVGVVALDEGRFGHRDFATISLEWVNGNFSNYTSQACVDCVEPVQDGNVLKRSRDPYVKAENLALLSRVTNRSAAFLVDHAGAFRCARDVSASN